jgi:transcriptional regulator with XRE-family HTH domain
VRGPFDSSAPDGATETPSEALGRFLRKRREAIAPEQVGIASRRGRRTPGLRREEVAFLADIGVKWYARLEAGDDVHPSESTLTSIAGALQLTGAEFEYMRDLADLRHVSPADSGATITITEPMVALLANLRGVAASIGDKILTPLRWNALADAVYGHSRFEDPVERNALVRCLFDQNFIAFLGSEREALLVRAVGMFRLNYSKARPSPYADAVYERVKDHSVFQWAWNRRVVAGELSDDNLMVRNHPIVGRIAVRAVDLGSPTQPDLLVRALVPADRETASNFRRLEADNEERLRRDGPPPF